MLIDAAAAADLLGIGSRTLWGLTKSRAIPSRKLGRLVRYSPEELKAWISAGCPTEAGAAELIRKEANR